MHPPPPAATRRDGTGHETGEPVILVDTKRADPENRARAESIGARSIVAWPVTWRGELTAVLGHQRALLGRAP